MLVYFKNEFIASMKELIVRYKKAIELGISKSSYESKHGMSCLLCNPIGVTQHTSCRVCPWMVIEGYNCDNNQNDVCESIYETNHSEWMYDRIDELKEWIEIYENSEEI